MARKQPKSVVTLESLLPPKTPKSQAKSLDLHFRPKTRHQKDAVELWDRSRVLFLLGEAGTGKTALGLWLALKTILGTHRDDGAKPKLMLTRPMETVDEKIGFLPGTIEEKIGPFLKAFGDVFGSMSLSKWGELEKEVEVETVPIGMLRGRTITNGFLIGDELQNATEAQIKCFLTRLGTNSKLILCGDTTQSDRFETPLDCPLTWMAQRLERLDLVSVVRFNRSDILRDPLIIEMLEALD